MCLLILPGNWLQETGTLCKFCQQKCQEVLQKKQEIIVRISEVST